MVKKGWEVSYDVYECPLKILALSLGEEDYGRKQMLRLTALDISVAIGHGFHHWFAINVDVDWGAGWYWGFHRISKRMVGEQFFEMLLRRFAPGWKY